MTTVNHIKKLAATYMCIGLQWQVFQRRFCPQLSVFSLAILFAGFCQTTVLAGLSVTATPNPICVGGTITVSVTTSCGNYESVDSLVYFGSTLANLHMVSQGPDSATYEGTYTTQAGDGGKYLTWAFFNDCFEYDEVTVGVVAVNSVTVSPNYADNWIGNTITFTAHTVPAGVNCPCKTTWTGDVTSGSTGSSTSKSYDSTGSKTATAHVGISSASATVTIHTLVSTCDADCPSPKVGRTDLGIGETVKLTVSPSVTPFAWSLLNAGHSSISSGNFTASQTGGESPTVQCQLGDASGPVGTFGPYSIKAPTGMDYLAGGAVLPPYDTKVKGPPNNQIGYGYAFFTQFKPTTVSLAKARMREHLPYQTHTFPDGGSTMVSQSADIAAAIAPCQYGINKGEDDVQMALYPISVLLNGGVMTADSYTRNCPLEYKDAENNWVEFVSGSVNTHVYSFAVDGVTTISVPSQSRSGGPWK